MTRLTILKALIDIYNKEFPKKKSTFLTENTLLELDLGLDSFDQVELSMNIEEYFLIKIPERIQQNLRSVKDIIDIIERQL